MLGFIRYPILWISQGTSETLSLKPTPPSKSKMSFSVRLVSTIIPLLHLQRPGGGDGNVDRNHDDYGESDNRGSTLVIITVIVTLTGNL